MRRVRKPTTEQVTQIRKILRQAPAMAQIQAEAFLEGFCIRAWVSEDWSDGIIQSRMASWKGGTRALRSNGVAELPDVDKLIELSTEIRTHSGNCSVLILVSNVSNFIRDLKKHIVLSAVHES